MDVEDSERGMGWNGESHATYRSSKDVHFDNDDSGMPNAGTPLRGERSMITRRVARDGDGRASLAMLHRLD